MILFKNSFNHEICLTCEEKGVTKCYFKSKTHKCKNGGTPESMNAMYKLKCFICLDLQPVLEKQEVVDHRIQALRSLGQEFVVTTVLG